MANGFPILTPALVREIEALKVEYYAARVQGQIEAAVEDVALGRFGHTTAFRWPDGQRVFGLCAQDVQRVDEVLAWLDPDLQAGLYMLPLLEDEPMRDALAARGYVARRSQAVLCGVPSEQAHDPAIAVRWVTPDDMRLFVRTYVQSYGWKAEEGEDIEGSLLAQYSGPRWRMCMAAIEGRPVAIGVLYVGESGAFLTNAATMQDYRGRGCQTALLHLRIGRARREGCALVSADTTPYSQSQRNMERVGMRLAYQRVVWERPAS